MSQRPTKHGLGDLSKEIRPQYSAPEDDLFSSSNPWTDGYTGRNRVPEALDNIDLSSASGNMEPTESYFRNRVDTRNHQGEARGRNNLYRTSSPSRSRLAAYPSQHTSHISLFGWQVATSVFLVLASVLVFQSHKPVAGTAQNAIKGVFATDYTRIELPAGIAREFGSVPSSGIASVPAVAPTLDVVLPLSGSLIRGFSVVNPDVVISGRPGSPVVAAAEGLVNSSGESQANGFYLTIDHGAFGQTFYAHLGRLAVRPHEYVMAGETIGWLPTHNGQLTFGLVRGGAYTDPTALLKMAKP